MASSLKKGQMKLDMLPNIDMLLMVEKGVRGGIYHVNHQYTKANNKYLKNFDKIKKSFYPK